MSDFNIETIYDNVLKAIDIVGERFKNYKGLIVTESDLKCQLYSELRQFIREDLKTNDPGILGTPLHTEVPFYNPDESNYANMPVDIVIFDPSEFSIIKDPKFRFENGEITNGLPGKKYRTLGDTILIELKFNKQKNGITKSFNNSILKDIEKLETIINFNSNKVMKGISVIFNKTDNVCKEFENEVLKPIRNNIDVIYKSSNLEL